jgi:hypothetical protein
MKEPPKTKKQYSRIDCTVIVLMRSAYFLIFS